MQQKKPTLEDVKALRARLFMFFLTLPASVEKHVLEKVIKGVNPDHDIELKHLLVMIHDKIRKEQHKQTSKRDTSLKTWMDIMTTIVQYLQGTNVESGNLHHGQKVEHNNPNTNQQARATSFASVEVEDEEEGLA